MFKLVKHLHGDDLPPLGQARVQIILFYMHTIIHLNLDRIKEILNLENNIASSFFFCYFSIPSCGVCGRLPVW